ncbi:IclR family transcriptional regulator [Companilactobacillus sp.]|jgi:DNA-binding IclR family transcriptional regulator|uniref:IclR family transcriptional regulator n=1 Tax=Companilactobacillus sp. TaxID=2767905 RepID=UPI0025C15386|nr:IclR family transcriptional regulator C-terminal domain-containing protein [Companilactobacillus sp.]MCH4009299.1 helix-turn-helix domain-containing protein [Companilactobacillus sp.]MCH4050522.1 helix-turn-helix domain-containing protein [Companilactobacillus sp.]MCH4077241.1 helix-turn-helix domain-containing protein [Companilactobacillus sp.]MCH4125817.1 helix-turn-helix domain-containing protein [Companilactobacillus sp.]MCI1311526.1 helix-turn-helix domain-containing protein [Companila
MTDSSSTLRNGLRILDLLEKTSGLSLTAISKQLGINKSTAYRLLATLIEEHRVKKIQLRYSLVHADFHSRLEQSSSLNPISIPVSNKILDKFDTTAFIGILDKSNVVITQVFPKDSGFSEFRVLGNVTTVHLSALGKAIVAFLPKDSQHKILNDLSFTVGTKYTLDDQNIFQRNLDVIKNTGFALDDEESSLGIRCLAVPIFRDDQVIASFGLSGTFQSLPRTKLQKIAKQLAKSSQEITNEFF